MTVDIAFVGTLQKLCTFCMNTGRKSLSVCSILIQIYIVSITVSNDWLNGAMDIIFYLSKTKCFPNQNDGRIKQEKLYEGTISPHLIICWHYPHCLSVNSTHPLTLENWMLMLTRCTESLIRFWPPFASQNACHKLSGDSSTNYLEGLQKVLFLPCVYTFKCHRPCATWRPDAWAFL